MATRLRTPSTDQSSRRPSHHTTRTRRANFLIDRCPDTGSTFTTGSCVFLNYRKAEGLSRRASRMLPPPPTTPPFELVSLRTGLYCNGIEPGHFQ
ncbi:hypothetical protein TNCV_1370591 [Trichonephila clavipes]|nr:hypothetical protein TNCV_1370591 [Trichonephila clavipes]